VAQAVDEGLMLILRTPRRRKSSPWEERLHRQILAAHLPDPAREFPFHPTRKWRFDFAWLEQAVAAEFEGAIFGKGRHTRGAGFSDDSEKYNAAVLLGWRLLRFTERQVKDGTAVETITAALAWTGERPMFPFGVGGKLGK
jgi:very-short-patch-repair endonuclease